MSDFIEIAKLLTLLCIPILTLGAAIPLGKAFAERLRRSPTDVGDSRADLDALEARLGSRLARLEQAVDAVSIEVERVGEAQRYAARSLPGATRDRPVERDAERYTTPHPR